VGEPLIFAASQPEASSALRIEVAALLSPATTWHARQAGCTSRC
jgi:hypothetical protein